MTMLDPNGRPEHRGSHCEAIRRPRARIDHPAAPLVWSGRYRGATKTAETLTAS
jgi:hypothetical protein